MDINDKMRAILVDWLVEVHLKFKVSFWFNNDTDFVICCDEDSISVAAMTVVFWTDKLQLPMQLMPETLFLTMNVIDRFLEQKPMTRKNLQLVCTSTFSHCSLSCASLPMHALSTTMFESAV